LPSLFLLFLQQIISDRLRKPAETLAALGSVTKRTEKTAAAEERTARISKSLAHVRRGQQDPNNSTRIWMPQHILRAQIF